MKTRELPEKINPGDELEVQLAPIGEWPNVVEKNGRQEKVVQRFGPDDAEKIVAAFSGELKGLAELRFTRETPKKVLFTSGTIRTTTIR